MRPIFLELSKTEDYYSAINRYSSNDWRNKMTVRTRFAPSPTGYLHVGGVRTALYAWLFAKKNKGQFILRIEDTDQERSTDESVQAILQGMEWLGLDYDEGPFYQTKRLTRYHEIINQLLEKDLAYRCTCTSERLDDLRASQMKNKLKPKYDGCCREKSLGDIDGPYVIRFKNPQKGSVTFDDYVYGTITVANEELDDLIIQKSDGMPTYNLAVVVDDMDMEITDVIRGDDHINNTPRQINLFNALGAKLPKFAHLPMILGDDGKRLSKRHGAVNIMQFKEEGYLAQTMLNYLVRLGWSSGDQEIFSKQEMSDLFDLSNVSKGGSSFSFDKLNWLNQHYLKETNINELITLIKPIYENNNISLANGPELLEILPAFIERAKTLVDIVEQSKFLFIDNIKYDEKAVNKQLKPKVKDSLLSILDAFDKIDEWQVENLNQAIEDVCQKLELKMGKVAQPIRVAITGSTMSPSIDISLQWLGRERTLMRIKKAIDLIPQ